VDNAVTGPSEPTGVVQKPVSPVVLLCTTHCCCTGYEPVITSLCSHVSSTSNHLAPIDDPG
jgi:hypothetical protein